MNGAGLADALALAEPQVLYRPIASSALDGVAGLRSQVRWRTPDGDALQEDAIARLARSDGLDVALDRYVLEDAASRLAEWATMTEGTVVWAGLTGASGIEAMTDSIVDAARASSAERHRLGVRWPADALVASDPDVLLTVRREGVAVMVGDVVPDHAALLALEEHGIDVVQLDAGLVRSLPEDPDAVEATREVVRSCARYGVPAVAAGVDHHDVLEILEALGIDQVEGVVAGRAEPPMIVGMLLQQVLARPR